MIKIQRTVRVDQPIDLVAAKMQDFCTTNEWDPGTVKTERLSGDGGLGTTYRNVSRFAGRETEMIYTVDQLRDGHMISICGENPTVQSRDTMEFTSTPSGTEIVYTAEFSFVGRWRLLEPVMRPFLKRLGDNGERGIRNYLNGLSTTKS